jgi:hypothetical protein
MHEEPVSPVPFEFRKTCGTTVFMGWLLSGKTLCVIGPAVVAIAIDAASNFLPIVDMYGICAGAISIWLVVHWTNESRDDPSDSEYI